jgi:hypothetical protein
VHLSPLWANVKKSPRKELPEETDLSLEYLKEIFFLAGGVGGEVEEEEEVAEGVFFLLVPPPGSGRGTAAEVYSRLSSKASESGSESGRSNVTFLPMLGV